MDRKVLNKQQFSPIDQEGSSIKIIVSHKKWVAKSLVWHPPTDVYETEFSIVVQVEVAGMQDSEISIMLENENLSISGNRTGTNQQRAYYQMEIPTGEFRSDVKLPVPVNYDQVEARYLDGFLFVVFPKKIPTKVLIRD